MIIVGSRSGGFDFYAKQRKSEKTVWLGATENSDLDIYIENSEPIPQSIFPIDRFSIKYFLEPAIHSGFEWPYLKGGILHLPQDMSYLYSVILKKFNVPEWKDVKKTVFDIYNTQGIYVTSIDMEKRKDMNPKLSV
jgi:hypothetical protein